MIESAKLVELDETICSDVELPTLKRKKSSDGFSNVREPLMVVCTLPGSEITCAVARVSLGSTSLNTAACAAARGADISSASAVRRSGMDFTFVVSLLGSCCVVASHHKSS